MKTDSRTAISGTVRKIARSVTMFSLVAVFLGFAGYEARAEPLKVAIPEIPPFGYLDEAKKPVGIYAEFAEGICAKAGVECTLIVAPLARTVAGLGDGTYDALVIQETPKAVEVSEKIARTIDVNNIAVGPKGTAFATFDALKGKKFANLRGFNYDDKFNNDPDIKKVETSSYQMNVEQVVAGRVDGMAIPDTAFFYTLQKAGVDRSEFGAPFVLATRSVYFLYANSVKKDDVAAKLKAAGEALRAEDYFYKVRDKYIPNMAGTR
jgi:ABC-type amino acid transport substrate-binding protein